MKKIAIVLLSIIIILLTNCRIKEKPAPFIDMKIFLRMGRKVYSTFLRMESTMRTCPITKGK